MSKPLGRAATIGHTVAALARFSRGFLFGYSHPRPVPRAVLDPRDVELWCRQIEAADDDRIMREATQ